MKKKQQYEGYTKKWETIREEGQEGVGRKKLKLQLGWNAQDKGE